MKTNTPGGRFSWRPTAMQALILAVLIGTAWFLTGCPRITVPNVVGMTQADAQSAISAAGLSLGTVTQEPSETVPAGQVISQNPAAGASVSFTTAVTLVVSSGPASVTIPNVVGKTQSEAQAALTAAGLTLGAITYEHSATVAAGRTISQNPAAGTSAATGTAVALVISNGPIAVTVPNVVGMTLADAQAAIIAAGLSVGAITYQNTGPEPVGQVSSQNPAAGASVASGSTVAIEVKEAPPQVAITVQGSVHFDEGGPVEGAQISVSAPTDEAVAAVRKALRAKDLRMDWKNPTAKSNPPTAEEAAAPVALKVLKIDTVTDADGNFSAQVMAAALPARVLVELRYEPASLPAIQSARWDTAEQASFDIGTIVIPNTVGTEVPLSSGAGQTADASLRVENLPPEVTSLYAKSYDPDENPDTFPGEFAETASVPLNSSLFVWMEALDSSGNPVHDLSQAATVRSKLPHSQWADLEDINSGTDRIEIPIYTYDEATSMWLQLGVGWLEDAEGTVLPEDAQSVILDGTFAGDLFATYTTPHFSWMNVDYAFIGPWTLSRIDRTKRNDDCFYKAMQLAKTIARSRKGIDNYKQFDKPGHSDADVLNEFGDAAGPEIKTEEMGASKRGEFKGNEQGDRDDQLYLNDRLWNSCGEGATEDQKKNTILLMAKVLLHETAHWKWDVKHDDGTWANREPDGEAGKKLETDFFGGVLQHGGNLGSGDPLTLNGTAITNEQRDAWLNPDNWPAPAPPPPKAGVAAKQESPLEMTISVAKSLFDLGEEIPVTVQYKNISTEPIRVLNVLFLEGYPLSFEIVREGDTARQPFRGPRIDRQIDFEADFATLQPDETLQKTTNTLRDAETSGQLYNVAHSGNYSATAFYSPFWGLPAVQSNTINFAVNVGGSVSGQVKDATSANMLAGAEVKAILNDNVLATVLADVNGLYTIPELPGGTYTIEARASGYLRSRQENVVVTTGLNTVVNFNLSPLLAIGELRLVLTWGEAPRDLDSHLWLPMETPYHVYYGRRGSLDACPFAALDTDQTGGFGPETMTIKQFMEQGIYTYAIYNYSGSPDLIASQGIVQVFDSTGLIATINIPTEGTGRFWKVLTVDSVTGAIDEINQIVDTAEPYPDSTAGCAPPGR